MITGKRGFIIIMCLAFLGLAGCGGGGGSGSSSGTITGVVNIGGVIKGNVEVCLVSVANNAEFFTTTTSAGGFSFGGVVPGKYYVYYKEDPTVYTEPKLGAQAPRDVFAGQTVIFNISYSTDELPPGPPE